MDLLQQARGVARLAFFVGATAGGAAWHALQRRPSPEHTSRLAQAWGRLLVRGLGVRVEQLGMAPRGAALLVANHRSYLDIPVLLACAPCVFLAKQEVATWPVLGWAARRAGTVFVRRGDARSGARALRALRALAQQGQRLTVFAEGTCSEVGALLPLEVGAFRLAARAGLPVVPVALEYGAPQDAWTDPDDGTFAAHFVACTGRGVRVRVAFGPALSGEDPEALRQQASDWIRQNLRAPTAPEPGESHDPRPARALPL